MSTITTDPNQHSHDDNGHHHDGCQSHDHGGHDHHHNSHNNSHNNSTMASQPQPNENPKKVNRTSSYLDHRHENTPEMIQQQRVIQKLRMAVAIICFFLLVELFGGAVAHSLAIWSDAAHLLADLAALLVAWLAAHLGSFPVSDQHTFGLKRVESLAALFSTMSLLGISIGLAYEAMVRIYDMSVTVDHADDSVAAIATPHQVNGRLMSIIAFIGVLVNLTLAYVLGEHHVHLPSDDGCDHGHSHDHHDHHDHHDSDHHPTSTGKTTANTAATTTMTTTGTDHHSHSHDHDHHHHETNDHHSHDHGSCATNESTPTQQEPHTESTPLLLDSKTKTSHSNDNIHHERTPEQQKTKWKIPFSPQNINLQAAYLHVLGDLAQSTTVLLAGCIIWVAPSFTIIDPICTLLFCVLVFYSAYGVCRTSVAVLLQQVPSHLDFHSVREKIASVPHVQDVHDLHIWSISHRVPALTVHVSIAHPKVDPTTATNQSSAKPLHDEVLENIYKIVRCEYDIVHATIQIQSADGDCVTCVDRLCRPCLLDDMPPYPDAHVV